MATITKEDIAAVILCGGQAKRMGSRDKGLIALNNKPLISYSASIISKATSSIMVSANTNLDAYQEYGEVVRDNLAGFQGPLAGISSALEKTKKPYLLVTPCDGPFIQEILIKRFIQAMSDKGTKLCVASDGGKIQPTFAFIDVSMKRNLEKFLHKGERKLGKWFKDNGAKEVDFSDQKQMFVNLNSPQDFEKLSITHS